MRGGQRQRLGIAQAQDANITAPVPELERMLANDPFTIVSAEISRPKAKGDITLKADVSFGGIGGGVSDRSRARDSASSFDRSRSCFRSRNRDQIVCSLTPNRWAMRFTISSIFMPRISGAADSTLSMFSAADTA